MAEEVSEGDVVTLPSGGPEMTVLKVHRGVMLDGPQKGQEVITDVDFCWFTAAGEHRTGTLPLAVLRRRGERSEGELHAAMTTCCGTRIMMWLCPSCDAQYAVEAATFNPHSCGPRVVEPPAESPQMAALRRVGRR